MKQDKQNPFSDLLTKPSRTMSLSTAPVFTTSTWNAQGDGAAPPLAKYSEWCAARDEMSHRTLSSKARNLNSALILM